MGDLVTTPNSYTSPWVEVSIGERDENLQRAIAAHEAALTVYTKETHPIEWARTQINLGNAWRDLPTGDKRESICRAIAAYQAALTIYTREAQPIEWARTQNNLGEAWQEVAAAPAVRRQTTPGTIQLTPQEKANAKAHDKALKLYWEVYPGEFLVVSGDRLLDHGPGMEEVIERAKRIAESEGIPLETLVLVPIPSEEAFG
jgi:hypothetical protein